VAPNPCSGYGPINIYYNLDNTAEEVRFVIYTNAFRKIAAASALSVPAGNRVMSCAPGSALASGTYFYLLEEKRPDNIKRKTGIIIVINGK
jgi:hypothetical protein